MKAQLWANAIAIVREEKTMSHADRPPTAEQRQRILERLWVRNAHLRANGKPLLDVRHHYASRLRLINSPPKQDRNAVI